METFLQTPGNWGPTSLLAVFVLAILTSRLVPRKVMEDRLADADKMVALQEKTIENLRAALAMRTTSDEAQIESAKTVQQIVLSLPSIAHEESEKEK